MKTTGLFCAVLAAAVLIVGCRKGPVFELEIIGTATSAADGSALPGVQIQLWEKVLEGGSLSNTAELAASATTDATGAYSMTFERRNASEYDIRYSGSGLVDGSVFINPESVVPGTPRCVNLSIPEATNVVTVLVNSNPETVEDQIAFRFLNATSPCVCCNNDEVVITGNAVDSTRTCIEHSGKWLRYFATVDRISGTYTILDSVYTEPQQDVQILLAY
ncbi:MAG: hypothetical protein ACON34_03690 [Flavobacteriales bacterium]